MERKDRSNAWKRRGETKGRRQWTERKHWVETKGRTQWTERKNWKRKQLKSVWFGRFAAVVCRPGIRLCPLQYSEERKDVFFSNFIASTVGVGKFWNRTIFWRGCWLISRCLPLFTACVQQTFGTTSPDFQHFWFDPYHVFQPKGRDEFYHS